MPPRLEDRCQTVVLLNGPKSHLAKKILLQLSMRATVQRKRSWQKNMEQRWWWKHLQMLPSRAIIPRERIDIFRRLWIVGGTGEEETTSSWEVVASSRSAKFHTLWLCCSSWEGWSWKLCLLPRISPWKSYSASLQSSSSLLKVVPLSLHNLDDSLTFFKTQNSDFILRWCL